MNNLDWRLAQLTCATRRANAVQRVRNLLTRASVACGQGLVEYALILVLIAIVAIGVVTQLGGRTSQVFSSIDCALGNAVAASSSHPGNPQGGGGGIGNNTTTTGGC